MGHLSDHAITAKTFVDSVVFEYCYFMWFYFFGVEFICDGDIEIFFLDDCDVLLLLCIVLQLHLCEGLFILKVLF